MFVHVNGTDLLVERTGEGRPLVMVHGNGEDHTIFDEAVAVLKEEFDCVCPDSRGHGGSSPVTEFHYEDMAEDMIRLMEGLDLRDAVFYGFSDGGIVGLLAASRCNRISTLIVSGANVTPRGVSAWLRFVFRVTYLVKKDPLVRLMLKEPHISDETLGKITARTLVLAGSRDMIRERETRHIAETIPGAKLRILDGEDHGSYIVHSGKIAEIIRAFVREEERTGRQDGDRL